MRPTRKTHYQSAHGAGGSNAFTFVELLVVVGTIALLTVMLVPAFAAPKPNSKAAQCLNNQRQLALGWIMYQADNQDSLVTPGAAIDSSLNFMDWTSSARSTNIQGLVGPTALLSPYIVSPALYKCPADNYQSAANPGPRTRSVSLNGALGASITSGNQTGVNYFSAKKSTDLNKPGPANTYVFLDEQADSLDDLQFALDLGYLPGSETWRNLPASYHNFSGSLSFADGHSVIHQWVETGTLPVHSQTVYPVRYVAWTKPPGQQNRDYEYLESCSPYH